VETDKAEKAINKTANKVLVIVEQGHKVAQTYLESLHPTVREWANSQISKEK